MDEPVHLLGHSYGGICALEAALRTGNLATLVLYEPALGFDGAAWQPMADCVHTLPRELRSVNAFTFDAARYRALDVPTVLLAGRDSLPQFHVGVGLVRDAVDGARVVTMHGVDHEAVTTGPEVLTAMLMNLLVGVES